MRAIKLERARRGELLATLRGYPTLFSIIETIITGGGIPYLVGGSVRDLILGRGIKDIDIEVHELDLDALEKCLEQFGLVRLIGKQFGVLRIDGIDIDWSIPRRDSKGRKPKVELVPSMTIAEASRRRDVTMNALSIDLTPTEKGGDFVVADPYNGLKDMEQQTIRAVDETLFLDDPLRFYRVMSFIGRFEMVPDEKLTALCKTMDLHEVARERIFEEIRKLFLKSKRPSLGIRWLEEIGRLQELMPEIYELIGLQQPDEHHPEGDVFEHTMQSLDASARYDHQYYELLVAGSKKENGPDENQLKPFSDEEKLLVMWALLCHDLGKPATTDEDGRAWGHEKEIEPVSRFLKRFSDDAALHKGVCTLVRYHLMPGALLEQESSPRAYKRLALKLAPEVSAYHLGFVALCDKLGRNPEKGNPLAIDSPHGKKSCDAVLKFFQKMKEANVEHGPEKPALLGRHLLDVVEPGPAMGELLKQAYEIQIQEGIKDPEVLRQRVLKK